MQSPVVDSSHRCLVGVKVSAVKLQAFRIVSVVLGSVEWQLCVDSLVATLPMFKLIICRGLQQSSTAGSFGWADSGANPHEEDIDETDRLGDDDRTDNEDGDDDNASDGSGSVTDEDSDKQRGTGRSARARGGSRKVNSSSSSRGQLPVVKLSKFEEDRLQQRKEQHKALVAQPKVCVWRASGWTAAVNVILLAELALSVCGCCCTVNVRILPHIVGHLLLLLPASAMLHA
jgi:hypothetical protein